jgi:hypothetical protein
VKAIKVLNMKSLPLIKFIVISFLIFSKASVVFAQNDSATTGKVYFMRKNGFVGSGAGYNVFIDSAFVCKLNEKRYSVHDVAAGNHSFSVQFGGRKSKSVAEKISVDIESGKTYYIELIFQSSMFFNNIYCQEVTVNSAKTILPSLKEDKNCNVKE